VSTQARLSTQNRILRRKVARQLLSAQFNRVGFLLSPPKNSAHNLIKLHIENELVRIFAGWSESCFIHAALEKRRATHNCLRDLA
jgi:hypothetical protein